MEFEIRTDQIIYCKHCTLPMEYCYKTESCVSFWKEINPDVDENELNQEFKKPSKVKMEKQKEGGAILVQITSRSKTKHVTTISGLDEYNIELKKFAKELSKQFACSCSVTNKEIVIQGDLSYEITDILKEKVGEKASIEVKKKEPKKKEPPAVAPQ
eukprot:NODE_2_length_91304_cov_0.692462.p65 type:complete len:157 gc:universal NODE_2_length_91304_cov_0.692462:43478-43948(+)